MQTSGSPLPPTAFIDARPITFAELEGLPACVARYFRRVLVEGQAPVATARALQRGEILMRPERQGWYPFEGVETFSAQPPGFIWDARVRLAPGLRVHVVDAFRDGAGSMRATLLGVVPLASARGTPELAAGALHRYLAEAVLLPTALLPRCGVAWRGLGYGAALASLSAGGTTVALEFRFGHDGLVASVFAPGRMRDVHGRGVPTPWHGRWSEYARSAGMLVPRQGEVEWLLQRGPQPYWRGAITSVEYQWAGSDAEAAAAPTGWRRKCVPALPPSPGLPMA